MFAIIEAAGKQYGVTEGSLLRVDCALASANEEVVFNRVLLARKEGAILVGKPYLDGAKVTGRVVSVGRSRKIIVFKYKPKVNYRRKRGHRQPMTVVRIEKIEVPEVS
ncbi:MAG: 50S ribosomal protein L21 [Candidatus Caldatribacterium sp.]|uniref:50S ribosomal protein L21 n=1 Tax=Candidatus Caldatribacterium sp. TaxID=2282143 RepID=UPI002991A0EF|nr:50S ribosomal protein L21 [Candidatus Caldatribacterium sp.]MCX7729742.1 50S ribosomal protein L21 [Candidatus Caldatribacterium sp.]MDW8080697.1 50S ribosomal protein L21 [Candidatus Calescibacterium sp.]